ncbi:unnamed protein product [Vicia faba]|uniref:Histidine-containing phosphotransfer protein n=1 Tax=Vicia faba TaxID=3906 RepID=A0AAV1B448_VICFA|nr:unnamed protein product [Vicia faba]
MDHLQRKLRDLESTIIQHGILDDQFSQLQKLQDDSSPDFVYEVITLFFADSDKLLNNMSHALGQKDVNFKQIDAYAHQQKGSSASVGAAKVTNICSAFRSFCEAKNLEGKLCNPH